VAATLGITGTSRDPINHGPPNLSFTNFGGLSDATASIGRNQTVNFSDAITYVVKKKHNATVGFSYRRLQQNSLTYANARGSFSFSGLLTSGLDANGNPLAKTGFDFADFLLGLPQSSSLRFGSDNNYFRSWSASWYGQDDYRLSRRLSFTIGLRYEYFAPYTELHGHLANLDLSPGFTSAAVVTAGHAGPYSGALPGSLVHSDPNNFSPRLGFAFRPLQKNGPVIRGGYSIFYSGSSYAGIATSMASQPPFATTASLTTSPANPLTLENGFPAVPAQTVTNTYAINPNYLLAYAQTWTLAVQQSLPRGLFVELEYIGTKGTDLSVVEQPNRASPGSPLTAQQRLQISNATGFNYQTLGGNSSYNAGQVRLTRRFSRGMSGTALYTFAKAIDNASGFNGTGGTVVQFVNDWHNERGLSTFDQRQHLQLTYLLSSPVGIHGILRNGGWKTTLLTGWLLAGNFDATSGTPLTARVAGNLSNTGGIAAFGTGRAEATGLPIEAGDYPYFNLLAFTTPPAGQYGNAGRNTIPGLVRTFVNASLNRSFRLGSDARRRLQLRLSASNALNHITITNIGATVNSATYGLPTAASATRVVTASLRFNF
jgi:trimeric autotransporter adhesin